MDLSIRLKTKRQELNLTQEYIADKIHVSRQTISNWETGRTLPDINSLILISEIYKISLDELIKGDKKMIKKLSSDSKQAQDWFVASNILSTVLSLFINIQSGHFTIRLLVLLLILQTIIITYIGYNGKKFLIMDQENLKGGHGSMKIKTSKYIVTENHILYITTLLSGISTILVTALTI